MKIKLAGRKKKIAACLGSLLMLISVTRVLILFLESLAIVRDERGADAELLELCKLGSARGSMKMRAACLQAKSERASPLILKALMKAISTSYYGFLETVSTKGGLLMVILFLLSSVAVPVIPWIRATLSMVQSATYDDDEPDDDIETRHSVIVLNGENEHVPVRGLKRRITRLIKGAPASRARRPPAIVELPRDENGFHEISTTDYPY
jgi:hypothetical protein